MLGSVSVKFSIFVSVSMPVSFFMPVPMSVLVMPNFVMR